MKFDDDGVAGERRTSLPCTSLESDDPIHDDDFSVATHIIPTARVT